MADSETTTTIDMPHRFNHLFAFVSEQAIDAVSVLFDQQFQVQHVTLMGLKRDMHKAAPIASVLQDRLGVQVNQYQLPSPHQPLEFCSAVKKLISQAQGKVAVNLNTDDAVCACLVLEAAQSLQAPVFAIETQYDRMVWLSASERALAPKDIEDQLHCLDVFEMHGFQYIQAKPVHDYATKLQCAKALLNIAIADETLILRCLPRTQHRLQLAAGYQALVAVLEQHNMLERTGSKQWHFVSEDALNFVRGSWLEFAVYDVVSKLAPYCKMVDHHRSWAVRHQESALVCEFDIVFMLNNELHIIECKSGDSRGAKFLTHFEGITRTHGLRARTMLVSVDELSPTLVATANGLGTAQMHGAQLKNLELMLKRWMQGG